MTHTHAHTHTPAPSTHTERKSLSEQLVFRTIGAESGAGLTAANVFQGVEGGHRGNELPHLKRNGRRGTGAARPIAVALYIARKVGRNQATRPTNLRLQLREIASSHSVLICRPSGHYLTSSALAARRCCLNLQLLVLPQTAPPPPSGGSADNPMLGPYAPNPIPSCIIKRASYSRRRRRRHPPIS